MRTFILICIALLLCVPMTFSARADYLVVPIQGTIDGGVAEFVIRVISEASEQNMDGIVFHVNTPGGRIDSAVHIKDTILSAGIPTIAFIDKNAISAGSLISIACDSIYMSTGASIGAATAVDLEGKKASEKVISYFRAQMRATAEATGRPPDIAEAMVDEQIAIDNISDEGDLVTLTYSEALELGFADGIADTLPDMFVTMGVPDAAYVTMRMNWAENIVRFMTNPIVSSLLMSLGFLGLLIELRTPGWGLGGTVALLALALFFGSHYIVSLAGMGEILLFTAGVVLLALEVFVIPGFGIAGIAGIGMILAGLYLSLVGRMPMAADFSRAAYTFGMSILITIAGTVILLRYLPRAPFFRRLSLGSTTSAERGYVSSEDHRTLAGKTGTSLSDLRPSGKALINGLRMDVVTDGTYIPKGTAIIVLEVWGARIVVGEQLSPRNQV